MSAYFPSEQMIQVPLSPLGLNNAPLIFRECLAERRCCEWFTPWYNMDHSTWSVGIHIQPPSLPLTEVMRGRNSRPQLPTRDLFILSFNPNKRLHTYRI